MSKKNFFFLLHHVLKLLNSIHKGYPKSKLRVFFKKYPCRYVTVCEKESRPCEKWLEVRHVIWFLTQVSKAYLGLEINEKLNRMYRGKLVWSLMCVQTSRGAIQTFTIKWELDALWLLQCKERQLMELITFLTLIVGLMLTLKHSKNRLSFPQTLRWG